MLKKTVFTACLVVFLGGGCISETFAPTPKPTTDSWSDISPAIKRYECPASFCGSRLIMYRFLKDSFTWRFEHRDTPSTVQAWAKSLPDAVFVANGLFFDEAWQPTGKLIINGTAINNRNYENNKSGLIQLSPEVRVIDTSTEKFDLSKIVNAGQSFPLIIKNGVPVITFKDTQQARRTIAGTDTDGNFYILVIPEDAITFPDVSKLLIKTGVKWNNVINLDGGTSTGFSAKIGNWSESMNSIVQIPNVIIAEPK